MNQETKDRLEKAGWVETTVAEFLNLTPEEEAMVETGLLLSRLVRETRLARGWSEQQLGQKIGASAEQIAHLEVGPGMRFELLFQSLYAMGISPREIAAAISKVELREEVVA